jgi:hypothetical protein
MIDRALPRQLDAQQRRMVAAVAAVAEGTVKRYLRGESLQPNSRTRIRRAIAALIECGELEPDASATPQSDPPRQAAVLCLVPAEDAAREHGDEEGQP